MLSFEARALVGPHPFEVGVFQADWHRPCPQAHLELGCRRCQKEESRLPVAGKSRAHTKGVMQPHATLRRVLRRFFKVNVS